MSKTRRLRARFAQSPSGENVSKSSDIRALNPILFVDILVVGGRIRHAPLSKDLRHPVILPLKHRLSDMILLEYHNGAHLGTEWTLSFFQNKYWIPRARNRLKKIRRNCVTCKKLYGRSMQQKMADYGGRLLHKCSFAFCCETRVPEKVWSDNGTNIVGARSEMSRSMKQLDRSKIIRAARQKDVEWVFNPPYASHHGGVWERHIRTVRQVMVAVLGLSPCLTDEIFMTSFCEIENLINSRPITKCNESINDPAPLTPNHLLILGSNESFPMGKVHDSDLYRRRWRHVRHLTTLFWKRWTKLYLSSLQKRRKWQQASVNLKIGDLVLVIDENCPRGMWPLGLVISVNEGRDGMVRSARLRTQNAEMVRPITKLVHLEKAG